MSDKKMNHAEYQDRIQKLPSIALRNIRLEAKAGLRTYFGDEISYCVEELGRREHSYSPEAKFEPVLAEMYLILKAAGYDSNDMVDDLKDLVNDSRRPATEEDEIEALG